MSNCYHKKMTDTEGFQTLHGGQSTRVNQNDPGMLLEAASEHRRFTMLKKCELLQENISFFEFHVEGETHIPGPNVHSSRQKAWNQLITCKVFRL